MKIFPLCFLIFSILLFSSYLFADDQTGSESACQDQVESIRAMEKEIADLKAKIKELEGKIDHLTRLLETFIGQQKDSKQIPKLEKANVQATDVNKTVDKPEYVYVSKSGKKYHKQDCRFLVGEPRRMTIEEAKKKKFEPCKFCFPESKDDQNKKENNK